MALRFRDVMVYAVPGAVGLLGCWWIYSHRKRHASYHDKQAIDIEEQQEVLENDSSPQPAVCVPRRLHLLSEEECPENETSTYLLSAGSTTPSLLCQSHGRLDLSQDLPDLSVMTIHTSTLEDDSEKLETIGSQDESGVPACVSLPLISKSTECDSSAAVSLILDSNQDQWPSESVTLMQKSFGITEISNAEQSDDSSLKPPKESQMPEMVLSGTGSVTAVSLGLEKKASAPQAFLNNEVVSSQKDSTVSMLPDSLDSVCLGQTRDEKPESVASTVPVCHEEDTQPKGVEFERQKSGGLCLDKEEVGKIEQVAIQIISKVILAATEEVLSGSVSDVSTRICQAAASRVERPLVMSSVSSDQMLAEKATVTNENIAAQSDAAVLTSPQMEEQDQRVTDSSCLTHGCLSIPVQGDAGDCGVKNRACSEEVLSGSVSDVSTRICQAAASQVERPLVMSSVSSDQMLAEKTTVANENIAAQSDAAVLTSPQMEEQDQRVSDSSCLTHGCLSIPVQGDAGDCGVKNCACSEEVLSGSVSDVSTRACQAAASCVETPLETASIVSSDQVPAEKATVVNENIAAQSDTVVLTSPQTEERDQCVGDSSSLTHDRLSGLVQGDTKDCGVKNGVCSESQGVGRTHVENHGGSLEKSPLVMEDSGYSTYTSECGTSVEDPLQNTMLSGPSGQHLDSLGLSATQDTFPEQSSVPSEKPALKLPEDSVVPYSNGVLKEDGPDSCSECTRAVGMDGDHSEGSDVNRMDFVDSGCAMRKTMTHQNSKLRGQSSKSDIIIWEIEVPKDLVGRLIGRQGRFMSFLRQASGAKIYVSTLPYFRDSQVCHIEGSPQQVDKVLNLIGQKFKELSLSNIYGLPPPAPLTLHSLLMAAWLFLPDGVTVEVVVAHQINAGHMFLQQHTHPTFHVLRSLDQQMYACYSQPEIPTLLTPVEVGIICAAPGLDGAWLRAQVVNYFEETNEVELRYVDYGGYEKVKIDTLRQIRSDFLTLPFQGAEVLLDNVIPLPDEDHFSSEADAAVSEMTRGAVLVAQVTNYDNATGLPMIHLWNLTGDEVVSVNRTLVERGLARWLDY